MWLLLPVQAYRTTEASHCCETASSRSPVVALPHAHDIADASVFDCELLPNQMVPLPGWAGISTFQRIFSIKVSLVVVVLEVCGTSAVGPVRDLWTCPGHLPASGVGMTCSDAIHPARSHLCAPCRRTFRSSSVQTLEHLLVSPVRKAGRKAS